MKKSTRINHQEKRKFWPWKILSNKKSSIIIWLKTIMKKSKNVVTVKIISWWRYLFWSSSILRFGKNISMTSGATNAWSLIQYKKFIYLRIVCQLMQFLSFFAMECDWWAIHEETFNRLMEFIFIKNSNEAKNSLLFFDICWFEQNLRSINSLSFYPVSKSSKFQLFCNYSFNSIAIIHCHFIRLLN